MKGSAQAVRQLLQKSQHWADAALDKYPSHKYFTSPDWKMAVQYARTAQQKYQELLKRGPVTFVWTNVEQRILQQGYPVLSKRLLYEPESAEEMCKPVISDAAFEDPIEILQKQVSESHAQNKVLRQQVSDLQQQLETERKRHQEAVSTATAELLADKDKLTKNNDNLLDEVKIWQGRYSLLKERVQTKLANVESLQKLVDDYRVQLDEWEQKWNSQQTFLQHSTMVMQHALGMLTDEQRAAVQDYLDAF